MSSTCLGFSMIQIFSKNLVTSSFGQALPTYKNRQTSIHWFGVITNTAKNITLMAQVIMKTFWSFNYNPITVLKNSCVLV